ncbi:hypothetical protein ACLOJK_033652 [Asimina triloba]
MYADSSSSSSSSRNPEIRKDVVFNRWVIFSPARSRRPSDFKSKSQHPNPSPTTSYSSSCPFCAGNEHLCAPEIFRFPTPHSSASPSPSEWKVRVIQNLFPAIARIRDGNSQLPNSESGVPSIICALPGFGFHDVVIETPDHALRLSDLSPPEIGGVLVAFRTRMQQLAEEKAVRYVQIFKNHGASAGASLSHSHSQMMSLPFIPPTVSARLDSLKDHFRATGECGLCMIHSKELLIKESVYFFSITPYAASFPFEIWIIPHAHSSHFHELDEEKMRQNMGTSCQPDPLNPPLFELGYSSGAKLYKQNLGAAIDLGRLLKTLLSKLSQQLNDPPFNYMIHTSPFPVPDYSLPYSHWFIQIVPQLSGVGGFEIGSGSYINPVFPDDAARILREVEVGMQL